MRLTFSRPVTVKARPELRKAALDRMLPFRKGSDVPPQTPAQKVGPRVLDKDNHDPARQIYSLAMVDRIVSLAQVMAHKQFYAYQVEPSHRIIESLLEHDGEVLTALMSRQSGKTETLGSTVAAIAVMLPGLAKMYPDDWRLNITDDRGTYRGFADGVKIGIYAPKKEQAKIMFDRAKKAFETDAAKKVLQELGISVEVNNGNTIRLSNGSKIVCETASVQSKIEGATHHLLVIEETQDVNDAKIRKSLHPMVASTMGTIVKIGTATMRKCDFYTSIKLNERKQYENPGAKKNHFFYPYTVCQQYNSLYKKFISLEIQRLTPDSDEFRTSYACEWIFERGMFVTPEQLYSSKVALTAGLFSDVYSGRPPVEMRGYALVLGIDWGSSYDSTVVTTVAADWSSPMDQDFEFVNGSEMLHTYYKKHIINWQEFLGDDYETQFWKIVDYVNSLLPRVRKIVMDSNTCGRPLFDRFSAYFKDKGVEIVPFNFSRKVKSEGYRSLYGDIVAGRVTFPASPAVRTKREWRRFVGQMTELVKTYEEGYMVVHHPEERGAHDDYCDALMMANWGANNKTSFGQLDLREENVFLR